MRNSIIAILVVIVLGLSAYTVWQNHQVLQALEETKQAQVASTPAPVTTPIAIVPPAPKESITEVDAQDPNRVTYSSYKLGVAFNYLKDGGYGTHYKVDAKEEGDRIDLNVLIDGKPQSVNGTEYVRVFKKEGAQLVDDVLKKVTPESFTNTFCATTPLGANRYIIWDSRIPISYYRATTLDDTPYAKYAKTMCHPELGMEFYTDPTLTDRVFYIAHATQAVSYWSDTAHTKQWWQTVHLIEQ